MRSDRYAAARPRTADRVGSSAVPGNPRPRTNRPIPFAELAASLAVPPPTAAAPLISGITHASGDVRPGDLYAALPGARRHGAEFVADAGARGAVAVLTDPAGAPAGAGAPAADIDTPVYSVDALVRRARALQLTPAAQRAAGKGEG